MSNVTVEELLHSVHRYYPTGFPLENDLGRPGSEPYQLTPEFKRWSQLWSQALEAEPWEALQDELEAWLPDHEFGTYTPVSQSACYACIVYLRRPRPDGRPGHRLVRIAGAVSLIAPVYLVYGTVELVSPDRTEPHPAPPRLFLRPTEEMQPTSSVMARVIEQKLGYRPFPPDFADIPVPDVRVPFLNFAPATLINAFFLSAPEYLP